MNSLYDEVVFRFKNALPEKHLLTSTNIQTGSTQYQLYTLVLGKGNPRRALISAGIHGDEPGGVETLLKFLEQKEYENYINEWEFTLLPCINPSGLNAGTRENAEAIDLNRKFREANPPEEVQYAQSFFDKPFDLDIELHEDYDSPGYYLFQKEDEPVSPLGRSILDEVAKIMPLNISEEIEELPADNGLLARLSDPEEMDWWPMALYAYSRGCKKIVTLETATSFPMETRVRAHLKAIEIALARY